MERKNAWLSYGESDEKEMEKLAKDYRAFLDAGKTERECVTELVREAEANGYVSLEAKQAAGEKIQPGDKVYAVGMKKIMALFHVGQEPLEKGMNILGAHIDSPRLDVKQNPLYEDTDLAYLDTHYYGGVKKYQWVALPLAIHGVIAKKDGSVVNVTIGEDENDPVVYITDLLIHLAGKQLQKKAAEVMIFNIFPGTILTSHSIRDLIMICFFVLFQSLGNAAFQIIRMCDPDNRAIRCLHKFLHSIAKHRCILLRNILERITLIIIADLYAARNRRSNNIQLLSHQSVRLIKFFFVFPVFLYEFIYASKSQDRIVPIIPAFTHGMCLKTGLSKFIGNRLKSKMKILLDCKTLSEILCTKLCFHCFAVFLKHIFIHIFAEIIRKKPIFFLFCSIV